eukprot:TRINITY_DN11825_c0_g1_i1.p1 TRINITY_DN11825_c0_g1~~TRINITY_DN11825_c0_g1_i1.p1  ORF type:complete len:695 (+),score=148.78 TRINITY_DN11825_c0_g1_i1:84-2168(+)
MSISAIVAAGNAAADDGDDFTNSLDIASACKRSKKGMQKDDARRILQQQKDKLQKLQEHWSPRRLAMFDYMNHPTCESLLAVAITFNMLLVVLEAEQAVAEWQTTAQHVLLCIYVVELLLKIYTFQKDFFTGDFWNGVDFAVVAVDLMSLLLTALGMDMLSFSFMRIFRLAKLSRTVKLAKGFKELNQLLQGFLGAMKAIFWGVLMIFMMMTVWAIVAVNFINPLTIRVAENSPIVYANCERCHRAFSSVGSSITTFFQTLVAGDSWGEVAVPIIEEEPLAFTFFVGVLVTVQLVMLNLILALIVEAAVQATTAQKHKNAMKKQADMDTAEIGLLQICSEIDALGAGQLRLSDFIEGFKHNVDFADCMKNMDVSEADIGMIFAICDDDRSGTVDYEEFVLQLRRMKSHPSQLILFYITEVRGMMNDVTRSLDAHSKILEELSCGKEQPMRHLDEEKEVAAEAQKQPGVPKQEKQRHYQQEVQKVMEACLAAEQEAQQHIVQVRDVDFAFERASASSSKPAVAEDTFALQEEKDVPSTAWKEELDGSLRGLEAIREAMSDYLLQVQQTISSGQELVASSGSAAASVRPRKETKLHAVKRKERTTPRERQDVCGAAASAGDRSDLHRLPDSSEPGAEVKSVLCGKPWPSISCEDHRAKITRTCVFPGAANRNDTEGSCGGPANAAGSTPGLSLVAV